MTNSKRHKRQRRETSVPHSTYSNDEESDLDEKEYRRKSKGKEKLQEEDKSEDAQEEEEKGVGSTDKSDGSVQICGICLTEDEVERGKLDCCDHCFCFGCIMEWAKVESRCPTCKQRFVTIVRPPLPGVPRSRPRTFRIPHRNQVYQPSEEEIRQFTDPYQSTVCSECQEAGDERLLLLCDGCDAAAHTYCVGLGRTVPRGDWFCNTCSIHVQGFSSDDQGHEEGADGESSSPLHILFITQVQQQQSRQPPHRSAAPRLNRAGSRHTRLHPAPTLSQEAQSLIASMQEENTSAAVDDADSSPTVARTLSQQRIIRQRVNDFRNHWNQIRSGEMQFTSTTLSTRPRSAEANQPNGGQLQNSRSSGRADVTSNGMSLEQAWSMMEQARALNSETASAPRPRPDVRVSWGTSHEGVPTRVDGLVVRTSRVNQNRVHSVRIDSVRGSDPSVGSQRDGSSNGQRDGERDRDAQQVNHMRELRISRDGNGVNNVLSNFPTSSGERWIGLVAERSGRRTHTAEDRGSGAAVHSQEQERAVAAERGRRGHSAERGGRGRSAERGGRRTHGAEEQGLGPPASSREHGRGHGGDRSERRGHTVQEQGPGASASSREPGRRHSTERSERRAHPVEEPESGAQASSREPERRHGMERDGRRVCTTKEQGSAARASSREPGRGQDAERDGRRIRSAEEQASGAQARPREPGRGHGAEGSEMRAHPVEEPESGAQASSRAPERTHGTERDGRRVCNTEEQGSAARASSREPGRGQDVERDGRRIHTAEEQASGAQARSQEPGRGHGAEGSGRRAHAVQEHRSAARASSREPERRHGTERRERRLHTAQDQGSGAPARAGMMEKEEFLQLVKSELKPWFQLGHIDKKQHKDIARSATQELLATFGIEHQGPETRASGRSSCVCSHPQSPGSSTFIPGCCSQCLRDSVHRIVSRRIRRVGSHIL